MVTAVLKWAATVAQVLGAALLAGRIGPPPLAYLIMTAGAVCWMQCARRQGDYALVWLNAAFVVLNVVGICRWSVPA